MAKILMVLTNVQKYDKKNKPTGLWLGEATEFYDVVTSSGHFVDFVSPEGGYVPIDPHSFKYATDSDWKHYESKNFKEHALAASMSPYDVDPDLYDAIYYAGGHGAMWDFPDNHTISKIALSIFEKGGFITSVCHGAVGLVNIKHNGEYLVCDVKLTGFTNSEEKLNKTKKMVPFLTEDMLKSRGAKFKKKRAFKKHVVVDGQFITGQNPNSAKLVAEKLVEQLNK